MKKAVVQDRVVIRQAGAQANVEPQVRQFIQQFRPAMRAEYYFIRNVCVPTDWNRTPQGHRPRGGEGAPGGVDGVCRGSESPGAGPQRPGRLPRPAEADRGRDGQGRRARAHARAGGEVPGRVREESRRPPAGGRPQHRRQARPGPDPRRRAAREDRRGGRRPVGRGLVPVARDAPLRRPVLPEAAGQPRHPPPRRQAEGRLERLAAEPELLLRVRRQHAARRGRAGRQGADRGPRGGRQGPAAAAAAQRHPARDGGPGRPSRPPRRRPRRRPPRRSRRRPDRRSLHDPVPRAEPSPASPGPRPCWRSRAGRPGGAGPGVRRRG